MKRILFITQLSFFISCLSVGTVSVLFAQDTSNVHSFSLQQAIEYAYQNQSAVLNAVLDERIAKKKINEITGMGLPQINASFDLKDFLELPTQLIPAEFFGGLPGTYMPIQFGTQYNATAGFEASQLIFNSSYLVGLQASKTFQGLSRKNVKRTKIETAVAVSKAYYTVLVNKKRLELLEANVTRLQKILDDTKVLYDNGFVEKIDLDRLTVNYNNLLTEKGKIQKLMKIGNNLLKFQMGMDINTGLILTDDLENIDLQTEIFIEKFSYADRVEYSLLETQKRLMTLDLKKNKMSYLPSLFAYGSLSFQAQRNEFDIFDFGSGNEWYKMSIIGVTLTVPIFDGFQKNACIQQSKLELLKIDNNSKTLKQGIDLEFANAKTSLENALATLESQKKNMQLAEEVTKVAKTKYDQGVGSNLEILNAETDLKAAQTNYLNALYDAVIANIDLKKAMGKY